MLRMLITAGPTREPIDAVRFIGNRSSGAMGLALSRAAIDAGHEVTLLLGPGPDPGALSNHCRVVRFESTADLERLLDQHFVDCDVLVMAAAVADYRPTQVVNGKLPRDPDKPLTIELAPTPDLTAQLARRKRCDQTIIAFALEQSERLEERAREKMNRKQVNAIVANPLGAMESDRIEGVWLSTAGACEKPGEMSKLDFAHWLIKRIVAEHRTG